MNYFQLSDDELVRLHKANKINAITFLYYRYKNYSYVFIHKILSKTSYLDRLYENKDAIIIDSIKISIQIYDRNKGEFKSIFSNIVKRETIRKIVEFNKNPLSDYIPLNKKIHNSDDLTLMDVIIDEKYENPNQYTTKIENKRIIDKYIRKSDNPRTKKVVELRMKGYSFKEIAKELNCSVQAIYALMYRFKNLFKDEEK